jgi:glycosyltransferase involved in cell wall biosynthesis
MAFIIILGPAYPLRGGIAAFNERLARMLQQLGHRVIVYTFSLQYPSLLFPGKTQYVDGPPPEDLDIRRRVNSVNPFNWAAVGREIKALRPDLVITRFWLPFLGPSLGSVLRRVRKNSHTRIVCIADNVVPHEKRPGDKPLTAYFIRSCDAFVAMSQIVRDELQQFTPKPVIVVPHPLYDHFGPIVDQVTARRHLNLPEQGKWVLFFGFIRHYKGLDLLLEALHKPEIRQAGIRLLVAGECYGHEEHYRRIIREKHLEDQVALHIHYIADHEVKYYFSASDVVALPYRSATQSGIAPMAYHFEKPMIATRVGGLPDTIDDGKTGLLCEPDPNDLAQTLIRFYTLGASHFTPFLQVAKRAYSWEKIAEVILQLGLPDHKL